MSKERPIPSQSQLDTLREVWGETNAGIDDATPEFILLAISCRMDPYKTWKALEANLHEIGNGAPELRYAPPEYIRKLML